LYANIYDDAYNEKVLPRLKKIIKLFLSPFGNTYPQGTFFFTKN